MNVVMMIMFILYFLRFGRSGWYLRLVGNKMCFSSIDCWEEHANASRRELIFIMTILPIVALSDGIFIRYLLIVINLYLSFYSLIILKSKNL